MTLSVRGASPEDAEAVASIYAAGIGGGNATVVAPAPSPDEIRERIRATGPPHAWLVAQDDNGGVVGWAATMPYARPAAYAGVAKFSVYVDPNRQRSGTGKLLMTRLIEAAESAGVYKLTSKVFEANAASRGMLAAVGFREVGTHLRHVRFDGHWRDVVIVESLLGDARTTD